MDEKNTFLGTEPIGKLMRGYAQPHPGGRLVFDRYGIEDASSDGRSMRLPWEEYEKQIIANALRQGTSFNGAAKLLRISHKTVAAKARKYGLV